MKDLTVIIPILSLDSKEKKDMFKKALKSASGAETIIVVGNSEAIYGIEKVNKNVILLENTGNTEYTAQVNFAVDNVKTKYFSVLEYDDTFSKIWFANVEKYISVDTDNTFAFLPLTEIIDAPSNEIIGYANEAVWASSFSEEIGYLDNESMQDYINFNTSGAIFKTEDFKTLGKLKESMKLVFWYEFLLRALYKEKRIFVIPKIGYYHYVNREGSITSEYAKNMSVKEADWWIDLAAKEMYFPQDRKKIYEEE
jgi:hypothetical protein